MVIVQWISVEDKLPIPEFPGGYEVLKKKFFHFDWRDPKLGFTHPLYFEGHYWINKKDKKLWFLVDKKEGEWFLISENLKSNKDTL